jgi:hypothetical protein
MTKNFGFPPLVRLEPQGKKIIEYCKAQGFTIEDFNIIYIEGGNTDLKTKNADLLDEWNDVRCVITGDGLVLMSAQATTEPGAKYTFSPMDPRGAARLALGEHKDCWTFGNHNGQDALVQAAPIKIYRDKNKDGLRTGDLLTVEANRGLNQHTTGRILPDKVGGWSAGCLVGRYTKTHARFMAMCRASKKRVFSTIILDASAVL